MAQEESLETMLNALFNDLQQYTGSAQAKPPQVPILRKQRDVRNALFGSIREHIIIGPGTYPVGPDIRVLEGGVLTLLPGVTLCMDYKTAITCYGTFISKGTANNPVVMKNRYPFQRWRGLFVETELGQTSRARLVLENTDVSAMSTEYTCIVLTNCDAAIQHGSFRQNACGSGIISGKVADAVIEHTLFEDNQRDNYYDDGYGFLTFNDSIVALNHNIIRKNMLGREPHIRLRGSTPLIDLSTNRIYENCEAR